MKVSYWSLAILLSLAGAAAAEWQVDSTPIAWADAAEPANGVSAKLQVECLQDRQIASLMLSEERLTPERIGLSFRFDLGPIEHRIVPVGTNLRSVTLLNVSSGRLAKGSRFRNRAAPCRRRTAVLRIQLDRIGRSDCRRAMQGGCALDKMRDTVGRRWRL